MSPSPHRTPAAFVSPVEHFPSDESTSGTSCSFAGSSSSSSKVHTPYAHPPIQAQHAHAFPPQSGPRTSSSRASNTAAPRPRRTARRSTWPSASSYSACCSSRPSCECAHYRRASRGAERARAHRLVAINRAQAPSEGLLVATQVIESMGARPPAARP